MCHTQSLKSHLSTASGARTWHAHAPNLTPDSPCPKTPVYAKSAQKHRPIKTTKNRPNFAATPEVCVAGGWNARDTKSDAGIGFASKFYPLSRSELNNIM